MTRSTRRLIPWFALVAILIAVGILRSGMPPRAALPRMPDPNGYEDLTAAAMSVRNVPGLPGALDGDTPELEAILEANRDSLELLRIGLSREGRPPVVTNMTSLAAHQTTAGSLKTLSLLLAADAELARRRADWARQIEAATNLVLLARRVNGDLILDELIAQAMEARALPILHSALPHVPADLARRTARSLIELDSLRPAPDALREGEARLLGESAWRRMVLRFVGRRALEAGFTNAISKRHAVSRRLRAMAVAYALHARQLDMGDTAATAADLVPGYLPAMPVDPMTDMPMDLAPARDLLASVPPAASRGSEAVRSEP